MRFIGCKKLLLENIKTVVNEVAPDTKIFCDIFSGTGTVGRYFKQWFQVYSNDLLYFSYVLQKGTIENDELPQFQGLSKKGIDDPITYLNSLDTSEMEVLPQDKRFFQNNYAPIGNRMYINNENALRIDFARNSLEEWKKDKLITNNEYFYILACIIEGIPFVSNISGTYGAFHKTWDRRTFKKYELYPLEVIHNGKNNKCFNEDGVNLLEKITGDVLYVDPPYNERQYLPNYHVLETAAKYDFPELKGTTGGRSYENQRSDFCSKKTAIQAFDNLIRNARFPHIILSYSTDGIMSIEEIKSVMQKYGLSNSFRIYEIPYRRYKSRAQREKDELKELLIYVRKECI